MPMVPRDKTYSVLDLGLGEALPGLDGVTPGFQNAYTDGVASTSLVSGPLISDLEQLSGILFSGKTSFTETTAGYRMGIDTDGLFKFRIGDGSSYIYWDGTSLNIVGGLNVDEIHIPDQDATANSMHVNTSGDAWWGTTETNFNADNDNANAYILSTGVAKFQNVTLDNNVVIAAISSGTLPSIQGWQFDANFSSTDADTVAWSSGTLRFANGETRSIGAGNTGNMSVKTYIYYDESVSTTALQTTTTASNAVGGQRILIAIANDANNGTQAEFQVFGGKGGLRIDGETNISQRSIAANNIIANAITAGEIQADTITANEIASNTITATQIQSNTITATEMNVSQLSAITANMGTITAGTITLNTSGYLRGGQTDFNTGTGFFLGYSGGAYKLSIGNPAGNFITWDGTDLNVNGYVQSTKGAFGGDGSDGALSISSGTTSLDAGGAKVLVKNYDSISITGSATLTITNTHADGTILILRCLNDCTITSSNGIDLSGKGGAGGSGGNANQNGSTGSVGTTLSKNNAGGGDFGESATSTPGVGGDAIAAENQFFYTKEEINLYPRTMWVGCGSGGGGGSGASQVTTGTPGAGGDGGNGGGALILEVAGDLNFTTSNGIDVSGANGSDGESVTGSRPALGGGGGGGGGGGMALVIYNTATAVTGTINTAGGAGGGGGDATTNGGAGTGGRTGAAGGGGGSFYAAGGTGGGGQIISNPGDNVNGSSGAAGGGQSAGGGGGGGAGVYDSPVSRTGGSGGAGGASDGSLLAANAFF